MRCWYTTVDIGPDGKTSETITDFPVGGWLNVDNLHIEGGVDWTLRVTRVADASDGATVITQEIKPVHVRSTKTYSVDRFVLRPGMTSTYSYRRGETEDTLYKRITFHVKAT